jgi:hypothetical protein
MLKPRRIWVRLLVWFLGTLGLIFCALVIAGKLIPIAQDQASLRAALQASPHSTILPHTFSTLPTPPGQVHWLAVGDPTLPPVVLVHGSPGAIDNWLQLLTETDLLQHASVIAVDRPGCAGSAETGKYPSWRSE